MRRMLPLFVTLSSCQVSGEPQDFTVTLCEETEVEVGWADATLGFSAEELLALLGSPLTLEARWTEYTPDVSEATLLVGLSVDAARSPAVVTRVDAVDYPGGCAYRGLPAGEVLRVPLDVEVTDEAGELHFSTPSRVGSRGDFTLDASALTLDQVWLDWEFQEEEAMEASLGGDWALGAESCLTDMFGDEDRAWRESRLILEGSPLAGEVDIELGTDGDDDSALGVCWRGVWGEM